MAHTKTPTHEPAELKGADAWADYLKTRPLPVRADALAELRALLAGKEGNQSAPHRLIATDPALTFHVTLQAQKLQQAKGNSVRGPEHAVNTLGSERLSTLCHTLTAVTDNDMPAMAFRAYADSMIAGELAWAMLQLKKVSGRDELWLASVLSGLPDWLLWLHAPQTMIALQNAVYRDEEPVQSAEQRLLGCTRDALCRALLSRFQVPEEITEALEQQQWLNAQETELAALKDADSATLTGEDRARLVKLQAPITASALANRVRVAARPGWREPYLTASLPLIAAYLGGSVDDARRLIQNCCVSVSRQLGATCWMSPAAELLLLPEGWRPLGTTEVPVPPAAVAPSPAMASPAASEPPSDTRTPRCLDEALVQQTLANLKPQSLSPMKPSAALTELVKGLKLGVGVQRLALLLVPAGTQQIKTTKLIGFTSKHPLGSFSCDFQQPGLFNQLCSRPASLIINASNRQRMQTQLPRGFDSILPMGGTLWVSLFAAEKPIGVIICDLQGDQETLSDEAVNLAKSLCQAATKAMSGGG
ncbi:MAG: HDOD domain-containing protein [Marinobacter sp.]|nr:HDOD domain-containing protein [Marinobacter sp.]